MLMLYVYLSPKSYLNHMTHYYFICLFIKYLLSTYYVSGQVARGLNHKGK